MVQSRVWEREREVGWTQPTIPSIRVDPTFHSLQASDLIHVERVKKKKALSLLGYVLAMNVLDKSSSPYD